MGSLPHLDHFRVMKPIGLAIKKYAEPDANVFGYHISEPSLFIYGQRLFPKIEDKPLDEILSNEKPTYVILTESELKKSEPKIPYTLLEKKEGFSENGGEMALLLIKNKKS